MKKLLISAMALALATGAGAAGDTDGQIKFSVKIPNILVLYHWDAAELDLTKGGNFTKTISDGLAKTEHDENSYALSDTGNMEITEKAVDEANVPYKFDDNKKITVILKNSWAVRALVSGQAQLSIKKLHEGKLYEDSDNDGYGDASGTSIIAVSEEKVVLDSNESGLNGADATPPSGFTQGIKFDSRLIPAIKGDISFKLNLAGLKKSGVHAPKTDGELFQLSLTVAQ